MSSPTPSAWSRFLLAWSCFFRILFDRNFASRVFDMRDSAPPELPEPVREKPSEPDPKAQPAVNVEPALQLLALLQREGRLVDFLKQDLSGFGDAEVGAATRVVHEGCSRALARHLKIAPIRTEAEGAGVTLSAGYDASAIKLTGNVKGAAPYRGVLRHRGWRAESIELPRAVGGHDAHVLAPAEIEL